MFNWIFRLGIIVALLAFSLYSDTKPDVKTVSSGDGVEIAYISSGSGDIALIFIHGGYADKGYWHHQMKTFAANKMYRVIAVDLAGHGQSGTTRKKYSMKTFAGDVLAVLEKEQVKKAVLIGNSLGGPVALEVAAAKPDQVLGVVGVDTLNDFQRNPPAGYFMKLAQSVRKDFVAVMGKMAQSLFHGGTAYPLFPEYSQKMLKFPPEIAALLLESFEGYELSAAVKRVSCPIRCINGDTYPVQVEANRKIYQDFDAVILKETGHYPMLERPELFNRHLETILKEWTLGR